MFCSFLDDLEHPARASSVSGARCAMVVQGFQLQGWHRDTRVFNVVARKNLVFFALCAHIK